jgi:hypothetical protein
MKSTINLATCFQAGFLLGLFLDYENGGDVPPKRPLKFNGVHGVISQKIELFFTKHFGRNSLRSRRDSNRAPQEYMSRKLRLLQPTRNPLHPI